MILDRIWFSLRTFTFPYTGQQQQQQQFFFSTGIHSIRGSKQRKVFELFILTCKTGFLLVLTERLRNRKNNNREHNNNKQQIKEIKPF